MSFKFSVAVFTFYILAFSFLAGCRSVNSDTHSQKTPASKSAKDDFEWGKYWYENKDFDRALSKLSDALDEDPDYVDAIILAANALREKANLNFVKDVSSARNDYETAYHLLIKATSLDKDNAEIKYSLGLLFFQKANIPEKVFTEEERKSSRDIAIGYFQEVVKAKPNDFQSHRYLGILLLEKSDVEKAKEHLQLYLNYAQSELTKWENTQPKTSQENVTKFEKTNYWGKETDEIGGLLKDIENAAGAPSNR